MIPWGLVVSVIYDDGTPTKYLLAYDAPVNAGPSRAAKTNLKGSPWSRHIRVNRCRVPPAPSFGYDHMGRVSHWQYFVPPVRMRKCRPYDRKSAYNPYNTAGMLTQRGAMERATLHLLPPPIAV